MGDVKLSVEPGEYRCRWQIGGDEIPGAVTLRGNRYPLLEFDRAVRIDGEAPVPFGELHEMERLQGRLLTNQDIVVLNVGIEKMFPGRDIGRAQWAIVGMEVADVPDDLYKKVTVQVTGADMLFSEIPMANAQYPGRPGNPPNRFSVEVVPEASRVWGDPDEQLEIRCRYQEALSLHRYGFNLSFAPIVVFVSEEPLRVSDWVDRWIRPLIEVATFATRKLQTVASFQVFTGGEDQTRGVVFGPGIGQAPYYSSDGRDWMTGERALFTLPSLAIEFPALLRGWRNLQHAENPFVELYRLVLIQEELPPRAKILYLLQALEALHGHEHRDEDEAAQESFELRRSEVLEAVEQQIEDRATFNFLKKNWLKRKPDSLARRLRELALSLPDAVNAQLRQTAMEAMEDQLAARDVISIEEQLQMLRNDLSHGGQNYSDQELQPWVCAVETLCQANLLRLLGFDGAAIERSLLSRP